MVRGGEEFTFLGKRLCVRRGWEGAGQGRRFSSSGGGLGEVWKVLGVVSFLVRRQCWDRL